MNDTPAPNEDGLDPIVRQVLWNRLLALVEEQAQTIMRTAFCTIVRESGDLSAGIFDRQGRMLAQAQTGTPGFIHTLAEVVGHLLERHDPAEMRDGDCFVTNDPWLNCGHLHDFTVMRPVFLDGRPVGFVASAAHVVDVGGRGLGPDGRQIYEEGLTVPIVPLMRGGRIDATLLEMIRANVREPAQVEGDLRSLAASNETVARRLADLMRDYRLDSLDGLADHIVGTSQRAMLDAIRVLPRGDYRYAMTIDGYDRPIDLAARLTVADDGLDVDFAGSAPVSEYGINVVLKYTKAYTWFGIKCMIAPDVPTNAGSLAPVRIAAPENSILNALRPAPVSARHIVGHMLPDVMIGCLDQAVPGGCQAESGAALWGPQFRGATPRFEAITVHSGGCGGRPGKDGLSATAFPTNLRTVPVEVIEATTPLVVWRRELRPDSAGAGTWRGGFGQVVEIAHRDGAPFVVSAMFDRVDHAARGRRGGLSGAAGSVALASGARLRPKGVQTIPAGDRLRLELPGGGGLGAPAGRDRNLIAADVRNGLISEPEAREVYGLKTAAEAAE